jgi:hypothetical protein
VRKHSFTRASIAQRYSQIVVSGSCLLAIAATVLACGWDVGSDHSVRFNPYRTEKEFGRLPPLPKYASEDQKKLFAWDRDDGYDGAQKRAEQIDKLWDTASEAEVEGRLGDTRQLLQEYLDRTDAQRYARWYSPKDLQKRRNIAIDKLDALAELDHGASESGVGLYLAARSAYDASGRPDAIRKQLDEVRSDKRLRDNAAYLAAAMYAHGDYPEATRYAHDSSQAAKEFAQLAARYPRSEKREAALYMTALLSMKSSKTYARGSAAAASTEQCDNCADEEWRLARAGFERVMREYPGGRFYSDARGWLGHLLLLVDDKAGALVEYYRMLADKDEAGRVEALFSLTLVRHGADEFDMQRVEHTLEREPAAALAYAYHNIYNYVFQSLYERYWKDDKEEKAETGQRELKRIASFATRMMNRYPASAVGAGFVVRVSQAHLELGSDADASTLARRALALAATGEIRAEALWVAGVAEFRRHQYSSSRAALTTLVVENPNNRYTEGARRQLAMLAEDTGDIEGALDQYLALDYRYDVAYFIDVLMTPAQLAAFIEKRPSLARRDEMLYALGVRYLRDRRWNEARSVLGRVRTIGRGADDNYIYAQAWRRNDEKSKPPKERDFDSTIRGIRPEWVDQDLRTANEIERLERQVEAAQDDEARAEALYQVASYQYERSLLFYNPLEWQGQRHYLLVDLDLRGAFRRAAESQLLFDYMQKHDMAANSLPIFLEVARRFPHTRAARDALFTAAVCHERLAEYNNYWREIYSDDGYAGERMVTYSDVRAAYPSYRFPRGTSGWEPATRTVNGEAGWTPRPKPKPRPSRWARGVELATWVSLETFKLLHRLIDDVERLLKSIWQGVTGAVLWVGHWLWVFAMCGWLWFLWRRASEARTLMREALACCKPRPAEERLSQGSLLEISSSLSVLGRYLNRDMRDRWLEAGYDLEYKLSQVARGKRGVSTIALYLATHGLFAGLFMRLLANL